MKTVRQTLTTIGSIIVILGWDAPALLAEFAPHQVMIVANANSRDSLAVAEHYAMRRGIPTSQIATLDLPLGETMSRRDYEHQLILPLREALQSAGIHHSIRVLVTVYGVPLRVGPPTLTTEERRWQRDASDRLARAQSALMDVTRQAHDVAMPPGANRMAPTTEGHHLMAFDRHMAFLQTVDEAVRNSVQRVSLLNPVATGYWFPRLEKMVRQHQGLAGLAQLRHDLRRDGRDSDSQTEARSRAQQAEGLQLLARELELPIRRQRADLYQQVEQVYGAYGVFALAGLELNALSDEQADASVDSELSLLWWDQSPYGAAWRQPNPLYHAFQRTPGYSHRNVPVLMVSRLDAPTGGLALRLIDQAIETERQGLKGTVYLDARGLQTKEPTDAYAQYDQSLRNLNGFLTQHTTYRTILENTESRFHRPGEAPDVALYIGWYRLRHYEDAFTFRPGAIGYHMASGEAVSIHTAWEAGWCKNALEHGITATLGSIGEPYLDAFPEPLEFVALLTTGQYSLVEAYYLTSRWVSWRMVLFGDPLYNPWKTAPATTRSSLTMFPLAPIAPSDQTFKDPILAREEAARLHKQARTRLDTILRSQTQPLVQPE